MTKQEKYETALKELQWKLKNVRAFDAEEVIYDSILIIDSVLEGE